jgi:hypothetical protein
VLLLLHFAAAEVALVVIGVAFHVAAAIDALAAVPSTIAAAFLLHY